MCVFSSGKFLTLRRKKMIPSKMCIFSQKKMNLGLVIKFSMFNL